MDDEGEGHSIGACNAVEDEYGFDGEMPRPGSVGCGNDDGDAAYDEADDGCCEAEVLSEVEALECYPVVEEVAEPDG